MSFDVLFEGQNKLGWDDGVVGVFWECGVDLGSELPIEGGRNTQGVVGF